MRRVGLLVVWIGCLGLGACFGGGAIVDDGQDSGELTEEDAAEQDAAEQDASVGGDTVTDGGQTLEDTSDSGTCSSSNGGVEICDGRDNDCDGETDEGFDLAANCTVGVGACEKTGQYVCAADGTTECGVTAGSPSDEVCSDGVDNDCDGETDEADAVDVATWYADSDGDGFGDADVSTVSCDQPADYVDDDSDCDDTDATKHRTVSGYADQDGDGFTTGGAQNLCTDGSLPDGYVTSEQAGDCDDADPAVNPSRAEVCDGKDNNCDGNTDDDSASDAVNWYVDCDADGFAADATGSVIACEKPTVGTGCVTAAADWTQTRPTGSASTDCNDGDENAFPGQTLYFTVPTTGSDYNEQWDYDCNGVVDKKLTNYSATCDANCSSTGGWIDNFSPACGQQDSYQNCYQTPHFCNSMTDTRTQACH